MKTKAKLVLMTLILALIFSCSENNTPTSNNITEPTQTVKKIINSNGEISGASYIANDGSVVKMLISKKLNKNGHNSEITIFKGNEIILTLQSGVDNSSKGLGKFFVTANGLNVNYKAEMDASTIFLEEGKASSGIALINVSLNQENWKGSFDFGTSMISKGYQAPGLYEALPAESVALMDPFNSVFNDIYKNYKNMPNSSIAHEITIGQPVFSSEKSFWGSVCRAACWAGFSGAGVLCCGGTAGVACAACVALAAFDASLCADLCPA